MKKSPLALVKEKFNDKAGLVSAVEKFASEDMWVKSESKGQALAHVSNAKLLRLHTIFTEVTAKFGTRAKLIDGILEIEKRARDEGYKSRLTGFAVPRLYDLYKATAKRAKAAEPKDPNAKKVAAPKKVAAAAKKTAAAAAAPKKAISPKAARSAAAKKKAGKK